MQETLNQAIQWSQGYQYDVYGNRAVVSGYTPYGALTPSNVSQYVETSGNGTTLNRNHWTSATYDGGGNMTGINGTGRAFTYDAENRITSATEQGMGSIAYTYDGDGRRVTKTVAGAITTYVYDAQGEMVAEYGTVLPDMGTKYLTADMLGSTRLVTDPTGVVAQKRYDYLPFGEDIQQGIGGRDASYAVGAYPSVPDTEAMKFTGKERDAETGLDYFGARYMSSAQGSFTSPDPLMASAKASNPQSWNRYSYSFNNPLRFTDPTGMYTCEGTAAQCKQFEKTRAGLLKSKDSGAVKAGTAYGKATDNNGVVVRFADKLPDRGGTVAPVDGGIRNDPSDPERFQANLLVTIQSGNIGNAETIAHEGSHVADYQAFADTLSIANQWGDQSLNITHMETEVRAYNLSIRLAASGNQTTNFGPCGMMTECKFSPGQMPAQRDQLIQQLLTHPGSIYTGLDKVLLPGLLKPRQD